MEIVGLQNKIKLKGREIKGREDDGKKGAGLMLSPIIIAFKKCSQAKQKGNF